MGTGKGDNQMSGRKIKLGRGFSVKSGSVKKVAAYRDASHAIRAKKSKKQRPQRRVV
jgi:hypothetical protein